MLLECPTLLLIGTIEICYHKEENVTVKETIFQKHESWNLQPN
jgi:hypothetical protein